MTHAARSTLPTVIDAVKALAHPGRLRILAMLRGGDLCVCQVAAVLELAASTVSSHLSDLRRAGLVGERKSGKWVHYRLIDTGPLADLVREALRLTEGDDQLARDARATRTLRRIPVETYCATGATRKAGGATRVTPSARRHPNAMRRETRL